MKCSKLRRLLADGGPAALAGNQEAEDHLVDCGGCFAVLEAMTEIDDLLPGLPGYDVADEVVDQLLANAELGEKPVHGSDALGGRLAGLRDRVGALSPIGLVRRLGDMVDRVRQARVRWGIVAVPAVVLIGIVSILTMRSTELSLGSQAPYVVKQVKFKESPAGSDDQANREEPREEGRPSSGLTGGGDAAGAGEGGAGERARMLRAIESSEPEIPRPAAQKVPIPDPTPGKTESVDNSVFDALEAPALPPPSKGEAMVLGYPDVQSVPDQESVARFEGETTVTGSLIPRADLTALSPVVVISSPPASQDSGRDLDGLEEEISNQPVADEGADKRRNEENRYSRSEVVKRQAQEILGKDFVDSKTEETKNAIAQNFRDAEQMVEPDDEAVLAAERFLAERNRVEDLVFQEPRGYWANTYVPGDRTLRQLKARLDRIDGADAVASLHDNAHQISQPFDPPEGAALAVYLHGDRRGVETRERMLVQIGLKATSRRSGVRPAMNIGLVLDLRGEVAPESAAAMRALLQAFAAASELGDRFSLTVAGRPGGTVLHPGDLRHGPLTVAMTELFGDRSAGPVLDLEQAATAALATVCADDDPNAPLGSSALIVITSRELGAATGSLARTAHRSAIDGVPWSAVGIGRGVDLAELDSLVLAGQGNRRLLESAGDAGALVDRELAAVSRVVARAVRLRIRLAPGVQLVDVIGSQRLDEGRAQQVRDAEQSIDQRLSHNLGIETDRGLDEEGIQIVFPSAYADNAHVVLLDVVVPGPGPVADVTVRYKDLVHMRNGVARAHLRVGRAGSAAGPLELNVLANLLATEVASGLDGAADAVARGDVDGARTILTRTLDLLRGLSSLVDGLAQNADLAADSEMIAGYLDALSTLAVNDPGRLQTTADSLRYAGRLKILPPPVGDDRPE